MLKVEANAETKFFFCLLLETIALWVNTYVKLFDACLESTIHENV